MSKLNESAADQSPSHKAAESNKQVDNPVNKDKQEVIEQKKFVVEEDKNNNIVAK